MITLRRKFKSHVLSTYFCLLNIFYVNDYGIIYCKTPFASITCFVHPINEAHDLPVFDKRHSVLSISHKSTG